MKRLLAKIGRFFWSRGFLKFVLWTITLIVFLYIEEDWRGARAWAATKAKWEGRSESIDFWDKFIPPPIPDAENFAALPFFKLEPSPDEKGYFKPVAWGKAMRENLPGHEVLSIKWPRDVRADADLIRRTVAKDYASAFPGAAPTPDALAQLNALYPFLTSLQEASATHPLFRMAMDYSANPPAGRYVGLIANQIQLAKLVAVHATLALNQGQAALAVTDLKINHILLAGAMRDPSIIGGLVAIGISNIDKATICEGLSLHAWNDAQLAEIQAMLQRVNFLANYQFAMRCETAEIVQDIDYVKTAPSSQKYGYVYGGDSNFYPWFGSPPSIMGLWPQGWWERNKAQIVEAWMSSVPVVDLAARRALPAEIAKLEKELQLAGARFDSAAPWKVLYIQATAFVPQELPKFAMGQVSVDEAVIACALERYRLAHGAYPEALDALVPNFTDAPLKDIMNGEPYTYRMRPDGTYLLYSVGWNQVDDHGVHEASQDMYQKGDWVWQTPDATHAP